MSLKLDTHALGIRWVSHSGLRPVAMVDGRAGLLALAGLHPHKRTREPASSVTDTLWQNRSAAWPGGWGLHQSPAQGSRSSG